MKDLINSLEKIEKKIDEAVEKNEFDIFLHLLDDRKNLFKKLEKHSKNDSVKQLIDKVIEKDKDRAIKIKKNIDSLKDDSKDIQKGKKSNENWIF